MCAIRRSEYERKKEIMNSAINIILDKGLEKTTMEDIIAGTSLSKGGVYHYYKSVIDIFKDIMIKGIEYRNEIIKNHLYEYQKGHEREFIAKQIVDKIIDDNRYMPLYVEFLIYKKRKPELNDLMLELQNHMKSSFELREEFTDWMFNPDVFEFVTHFINSMIVGANILDARDAFKNKRHILEKMILCIYSDGEEY